MEKLPSFWGKVNPLRKSRATWTKLLLWQSYPSMFKFSTKTIKILFQGEILLLLGQSSYWIKVTLQGASSSVLLSKHKVSRGKLPFWGKVTPQVAKLIFKVLLSKNRDLLSLIFQGKSYPFWGKVTPQGRFSAQRTNLLFQWVVLLLLGQSYSSSGKLTLQGASLKEQIYSFEGKDTPLGQSFPFKG